MTAKEACGCGSSLTIKFAGYNHNSEVFNATVSFIQINPENCPAGFAKCGGNCSAEESVCGLTCGPGPNPSPDPKKQASLTKYARGVTISPR